MKHCLIYRFNVHEGKDGAFIRAWSEVTEALVKHCGALGSRLHRSDENEFIAYAQWPSREARDRAELPAAINDGPRAEMRACCASIETLFELTTVADHLRSAEAEED